MKTLISSLIALGIFAGAANASTYEPTADWGGYKNCYINKHGYKICH